MANIEGKSKVQASEKGAILFFHGLGGKLEGADFLFKYLENKGYAIYSPVLKGHEDDFKDINSYYPEHWFMQAEDELNKILRNHNNVYLVGASFGGNICLSLAAKHPDKVKGVVTLETPVFFNFKLWVSLRVAQPILELLGIEKVSKSGAFYRSGYQSDGHSYEYVPVKTAGKIFEYINSRTKNEVMKIVSPIFILQAEKSDLIKKKSANYIFDNVKSQIKRVEYLPLDNHDLDLFDEKEKILTMEKVYEFLSKI
ncbi:MAG: alpha/beta fold hydrolase [Patescibacteria group bacterium]|jgi:carboxylesterase